MCGGWCRSQVDTFARPVAQHRRGQEDTVVARRAPLGVKGV
jgi:hypothetical protein